MAKKASYTDPKLLTTSLLLIMGSAQSAENWDYCLPLRAQVAHTQAPQGDGKIHISADSVKSQGNNDLLFSGSVQLQQLEQSLSADEVVVRNDTGEVKANGGIQANSENFLFKSDSASFDSKSDKSSFDNVYYEYYPRHAHGDAANIARDANKAELNEATYSTCNPGNRDWLLSAHNITLDQELGFGYATLAKLVFKGVPLMYIPAITFPINDQRKSGLLYPTIGNSDENGLELTQPFYWNIAPNYDLTLSPRYLSDRGLMLGNNFRYLGKSHEGYFNTSYLNKDEVIDEERFHLKLHHEQQINRHWRAEVEAQSVSDNDYFTDFSSDLASSTVTHLERRADLIYNSRHLTGVFRFQNFQTVDESISQENRPYQRIPQINLYGLAPLSGEHFSLDMTSDFSRFEHDSLVSGNRLDIAPRINLSWLTPSTFIKPSLVWHYTRYDLSSDAQDQSPTRSVPTMLLDSGLVFDRKTDSGGLQTLEPRLFYQRTPYRDQSDLPVFDTLRPAFVFSSLFRENRYSGLDRIGDTNQLTAAITSRILDERGSRETFSAGLGQIFYFDDQVVALPDEDNDSATRSNIAAELAYSPKGDWSVRGSLITDSSFSKGQVATFRVHKRDKQSRIFNLEHRYHREDDINQTDLSAVLPIGSHWNLISRWLYSHESDSDLELLTGLEYDSCCWKALVSSRRYIVDDNGEYNNSLYLQLVLKGLASFGRGNDLLEKSIPGYLLNDD